MTKRVQRYVELGTNLTFDFVREHETEYKCLAQERCKLKELMSLEELESLKNLISAKEFNTAIMPRILALKEQAVTVYKTRGA